MTTLKQSNLIETINTPLGEVRISISSNGVSTIAICDMPKQMENGMSIEHTQAALVSITPNTDHVTTDINCELIGSEYRGTSSTGQYLDCIEWFSDSWHLTIGTEDTEILKQRYSDFDITEAPYPITYNDAGIAIKLNIKRVSTPITLHVLVSSKKLPDDRDCSAWFFADRPHDLVQKTIKSLL